MNLNYRFGLAEAEAVGIQSLAVHLFANAGRKEIPLEVISSGGS